MTGRDLTGTGPDFGDDMLSAYLDGELTPGERAEVEARLTGSSELRAELDDVRAARDLLRALPTREAPDGFWDRVTAAVAATPEATLDATRDDSSVSDDSVVPLAPARERREARRLPWKWVAGGVAVAAALGALFVIPGRETVRPNIAAVSVQHGASSAGSGDPISGLVPLGPGRGPR